jgi:ubiquinone/menaquinone biosynthesis C-methylase UbiE
MGFGRTPAGYIGYMPGRRQPEPFDPRRAELLDDPERERWLPTKRVIAMLDVHERQHVLDYGAGTGRYTLAIARAYPEVHVVAFDIQPQMLNVVKNRIAENELYNARTAGPDAIAIQEQHFDRVLGVNLLHEIDDEHLEPIRLALKPDGSLLIIDWDRTVKRDFGPPSDHVHTRDEALERLRRSRFNAEVLESRGFPYHFAIRATAG